MRQLLEIYWDDLRAEPIQMTLTWISLIAAIYYGSCGLCWLVTEIANTPDYMHTKTCVTTTRDHVVCGYPSP